MAQYSLAFDFGATSIRAIIGGVENGRFVTREVMRMSHQRHTCLGRSRWEWDKIVAKVVETIKAHVSEISSIAVNTWGVDFGLIDEHGALVAPPISYRDARHQEGFAYATSKLSAEQIFMATGNQIMAINSLFQLLVLQQDAAKASSPAAAKASSPESGAASEVDLSFSKAHKLLMLPDLLNYLLTGKVTAEITIASTSQLLDLKSHDFAPQILGTYGIKRDLFAPLIYPTTVIGSLKDSVIPELKALNADIQVVACASHDTASAVLLTEAYTDKSTAFLSCGTWSLLGGLSDEPVITKEAFARDLTNETGFAGTNMFFQNITGLYVLEMLKSQLEARLGRKISFAEITEHVTKCTVSETINMDAPVLAQNEFDVQEAIKGLVSDPLLLQHDFDYFKVIYNSLAHKYQTTLNDVAQLLGKPFKRLHMIGGGTQSTYLCQLVSDVTGLEVIAGPMEATAYGNLLAQQLALKVFSSLEEGRKCILESSSSTIYHPQSH